MLSKEIRKKNGVGILKVTTPNQKISMSKLHTLLKPWSMDHVRAGLRYLREEGLVTTQQRPGSADGSMVQFYKTPLPKEERDHIAVNATHTRQSKSSNGVFQVSRTFTLKYGTYTAKELRGLAREVLKELDEL